MLKIEQQEQIDAIDKSILNHLQTDGRMSNVEVARLINLSPPATHARIKRLEQDGFIRHYGAVLDRERLGFDLLCFIHIAMQLHQLEEVERFRMAIRQMPEVLECHHLTGEYDYLLKIAVRNRKDLERFVVGQLTPMRGVARIQTSLVFTEIKSTTALSLD